VWLETNRAWYALGGLIASPSRMALWESDYIASRAALLAVRTALRAPGWTYEVFMRRITNIPDPVFACWDSELFQRNVCYRVSSLLSLAKPTQLGLVRDLIKSHMDDPEQHLNHARHEKLKNSPLIAKLLGPLFGSQVHDMDWGNTRTTPIVDYLARSWFALNNPKVPASLTLKPEVRRPVAVHQDVRNRYDDDGDTASEAEFSDEEMNNQRNINNTWFRRGEIRDLIHLHGQLREDCCPLDTDRYATFSSGDVVLQAGDIVQVAYETKHARSRFQEMKTVMKRVKRMQQW
jgi:hypothetical protein